MPNSLPSLNGKKKVQMFFCLQEMWRAAYEDLDGKLVGGVILKAASIMSDSFQKVGSILSGYKSYFHPQNLDNYGLSLFTKVGLTIRKVEDIFVDKERGYIVPPGEDPGTCASNIEYVILVREGRPNLTVCNFHGLWNGKGKTDTPERLAQSEKILAFLKSLSGDVVLMGDFNLLPDTESIKMLEDAGYKNLIKEYGITSTRTSFYTKSEKFADYAFVSSGVEVTSFRVLPDEVSDHAALELIIK